MLLHVKRKYLKQCSLYINGAKLVVVVIACRLTLLHIVTTELLLYYYRVADGVAPVLGDGLLEALQVEGDGVLEQCGAPLLLLDGVLLGPVQPEHCVRHTYYMVGTGFIKNFLKRCI